MLNLMGLWKGYDMKWVERVKRYSTQFSTVPQSYQTTTDFQATEVTVKETWDELRIFPNLFVLCNLQTRHNGRVVGLTRDGMGDYTFKLTLEDGTFLWSSGANTLLCVKGSVQ